MPEDRPLLIALEGTGGPETSRAAKVLARRYADGRRPAGVSVWDASNLFFEICRGENGLAAPSARTLLLLYAADLAFRLRWEIRPALEEGRHVIAAPYIETAIAVGRAAGLPRRWLTELFRFAPKPQACFRVPAGLERSARGSGSSNSFLEFCLGHMNGGAGQGCLDLHQKVLAYLDALERRKACVPVCDISGK